MSTALHRTVVAAVLAATLLGGCGGSQSKVGPTAKHDARNGPIAFERSARTGDEDAVLRYWGLIGRRRPPGRQVFLRTPRGAVRQLTHFGGGVRRPAWSPDGSRIVFVRRLDPKPDQIWTMKADGSDARAVAGGCAGACVFDDLPAYSPDGRRIAFERISGRLVDGGDRYEHYEYVTRVDLMVVAASGGMPRVVRRWGVDPQPWEGAPTWSPDGRRIALPLVTFTHPLKHTRLGTAVFVVGADGGGSERRITPWSLGAGNPDWSPDGTRIVFNSMGGHSSEIYVVRPDGSGLRKVLAANHGRAGGVHVGQGIDPAWSPDGAQIVFESETDPCYSGSGICDRVTPRWDLYAIAADGTDLRRVTSAPQYEAAPAWAPG